MAAETLGLVNELAHATGAFALSAVAVLGLRLRSLAKERRDPGEGISYAELVKQVRDDRRRKRVVVPFGYWNWSDRNPGEGSPLGTSDDDNR